MAGVRFGFAVAHPSVIRGLRKVKDSYNCNTLSLAVALAAIDDQEWMRQNVERIRKSRARLTAELRSRAVTGPSAPKRGSRPCSPTCRQRGY